MISKPERQLYHLSEEACPEPPMCGACHFVLTEVGTQWVHTLNPSDGHVPIPVSTDPETVRYVCDFCIQEETTWSFPCAAYRVPEIGWENTDDWASCDTCKPIVESNDAIALMERHLEAQSGPVSSMALAGMLLMFQRFVEHRMGPPERVRQEQSKKSSHRG